MKRALTLTVVFLLCLSLLAISAAAAVDARLETKTDRVITYGDKATPNGNFWTGTDAYNPANGIAGKVVTLKYRERGKAKWHNDWLLTTDASGHFSNEYEPTYNTQYKAYFPGDADYNAVNGNVATTFVKVKVTASGEMTDSSYNISGKVYPSKTNRNVLIKLRKKGKGWMTLKRVRLNGDSEYSYRIKFGKRKGTYYVRVVYNGDAHNKGNASERQSFTI